MLFSCESEPSRLGNSFCRAARRLEINTVMNFVCNLSLFFIKSVVECDSTRTYLFIITAANAF